jgi:hypothetical protein
MIGALPAGTPRPANSYLSTNFYRDHAGRRAALWVALPNGTDFCLDACTSAGLASGDGWTVIGEPPTITVSPSINCIGSYHGWLQNGVLSEDCEGRTFSR